MTKRKKALTLLSSAAILAIGIAALLLLTSFKAEAAMTEQAVEIRTVRTRILTPGPQTVILRSEGFLQSARNLDLYSSVPGRVTRSMNGLKSGTRVEEGQILLSLDDRRARLGFESARSELINSVSRFIGAAGMNESGREAWNRYLAELGNADFNRLPAQPQSDQRLSLLSATMGVAAAGHNFESAALDLADHYLRAPFSGTLSGPGVLEESWISPGTVLATIVDSGSMELPLSIPAGELLHLSIGDPVTITRRDDNARLEGVVSGFEPVLNPGSQTAGVFAMFDSSESAGWIPGSFVNASIQGRRIDSAFRVPRNMLINGQIPVYRDGYLELLDMQVLARDGADVLLSADSRQEIEIVETVLQNPIPGLPVRREEY